jgi:NAD(P)-dependent dehydrogenase (short-subunit alcohol dehydrogenase family)
VKAVLITGASTGIGQACALHLDRLGLRVYAGVRTEVQAQELRTCGASRITPVILDVTDQAHVDAAAAQITEDHGRLDGLVNNAGIAKGGPLEYLPLATWREQFEVNVLGQVTVTKAMLPLMLPADSVRVQWPRPASNAHQDPDTGRRLGGYADPAAGLPGQAHGRPRAIAPAVGGHQAVRGPGAAPGGAALSGQARAGAWREHLTRVKPADG